MYLKLILTLKWVRAQTVLISQHRIVILKYIYTSIKKKKMLLKLPILNS